MANRINIDFDASLNISRLNNGVNQIQKAFNSITLPQNLSTKFTNIITELKKEIGSFETQAAKGITSASDFSKLEQSGNRILNLYNSLVKDAQKLDGISGKSLEKLFPKDIANNITQARQALSTYNSIIEKNSRSIESNNGKLQKQRNELDNLNKKYEQFSKIKVVDQDTYKNASTELDSYKQKINEYGAELQKAADKANEAIERLQNNGKGASPRQSSAYREAQADIEKYTALLNEAKKKHEELQKQIAGINTQTGKSNLLDDTANKIDNAKRKIEELEITIQKLGTEGSQQALSQLINELNQIEGINLSPTSSTIDEAKVAIDSLGTEAANNLREGFRTAQQSVSELHPVMQQTQDDISKTREEIDTFNARMNDISSIKNRILYFFSLNNSINLVRRALSQALGAVKELDATMTETAVVTDFSVSDMWKQLPDYTKRANELGVATNDAYKAATLYYQQGLKTNEVIQVSNETLKLAKIAALEAGDATDYMTSALRGFNMEINETSAQRVNDVYSQLAAKTASNVQEISIAMSKVASLAHNANMEFETTAAFLAQGIETTRESAETIGTALKTVIARFSEVKELYSTGQLLGTDEEGEEIDVNKVSKALRTAGINLNEYLVGMKGLDDIFVELSSKWNTLTDVQQRYIATMAAGSRQQSRFIAMMADYSRTTELIGYANNSAGASQEQFNKTLDSLESKLARLRNAWNEFTMNLANNTLIKTGVDLLTGILNTINKIINALSGGSGLIKSILTLGATIGAIKIGQNVFNKIFTGLGAKWRGEGEKAGKSFADGATASAEKGANKIKKVFSREFWKGAAPTPTDLKGFNDLTAATQRVAEAEKDLELTRKFGSANDRLKAEAAYKTALEGQEAALKSLGLSQEQYNSIQSLGLSEKEMAIVLENSEAGAKLRETLATEGLSDAEKKEAIAKELANRAGEKSIFWKTKELALLLFGTKATRDEAASKIADAVADKTLTGSLWGHFAAQTAVNTATKSFPFGWIFAAIAALVTITIALVSAIKTANERFEEANEDAKEAAERAQEAADAYNNLKTSLEEIGEKTTELENLTKGTQEYRDAVLELNQSITELANKYPDLLPFISNDGGVLSIDYNLEVNGKTVDDVISGVANSVLDAQAASYAAEIRKEEARRDTFKPSVDKNVGNFLLDSGISNEDFDRLAKSVATGELSLVNATDVKSDQYNRDNLIKYFKADGLNDTAAQFFADELVKSTDSLRDWGSAILENENTISSYSRMLDSVAFQKSNIGQTGSKDERAAAEIFGAGYTERLRKQIEDELLDARDPFGSKEEMERNAAYGREFAESMEGYSFKEAGIENIYFEKIDAQTGETEEIKMSEEEVINQIASMRATDQAAQRMDNFVASLNKIKKSADNASQGLGKVIENLYKADEGAGLQISDINKVLEHTAVNLDSIISNDETDYLEIYEDKIRKDAQAVWDEFDPDTQALYENFEEFSDFYYDSIVSAVDSYRDAIRGLNDLKLEFNLEDFGDISANSAKLLSDNLIEVFSKSGEEGYRTIYDSLTGIMSDLQPDEAEKFANALSEIDWSNIDSVEQLSDIIKDLGIKGNFTEDEINSLELQIIDLAKASKQVDLETLVDQIRSLSKIKLNITSGEQGRSFSEEAKNALVESGAIQADEFVYNIATDDYTYIGESTDAIVAAIEQQTAELLGGSDFDRAVASGEIASDILKANSDYNLLDTESKTYAQDAFNFINEYNRKMLDAGYNQAYDQTYLDRIFAVNEDGTIGNANEINTDKINAIIEEIYDDYYNIASNREKADTAQREAQVASAQTNDPLLNAARGTRANPENEDYTVFQEALISQAEAAGVAREAIDKYTQAREHLTSLGQFDSARQLAQITQIYKEAEMWGEDTNALGEYAQQLIQLYPELENNSDAAYRLALANMKLNSGLSDIISSYKDWTELIDENTGLISASNSEDAATYKALQQSVNKMLNTSSDLSDEFWNNANNIDLVKQAAEGSADALGELQTIAALDYLMNIDINVNDEEAIEAINELATQISNYDFPKLEVGTQLDDKDFIDGCNSLIKNAGLTQTQVANIFKDLGFDVEFNENPQPINQTVRIPRITFNSSSNGDLISSLVPHIEYDTVSVSGMIPAPTIKALTSTGSRGGGVSSSNKKAAAGNKGSGGGGGGGGSSSEPEKWENPYDFLYNLLEDINYLIDERNEAEDEYNRILENRLTIGKDVLDQTQKQLDLARRQQSLEELRYAKRKEEMQRLLADNKQYSEYATFNFQDMTVEIDWNKLEKLSGTTDTEKGEAIEEYISEMERIRDEMEDAHDSLLEIQDEIEKLRKRGQDAYFSLEDRVIQALLDQRQALIESESETREAILSARQDLVDAIQKNIEKIRQDRKNEKEQNEISQIERRLAYLRQDTSGSNALEIMKLEEELAEKRESYQDTLVDQAIQAMTEQNNALQEQNEREIAALEAILEWDRKTGVIAEEALRIMQNSITDEGVVIANSQMIQLLSQMEEWDSNSDARQVEIIRELESIVAEMWPYISGEDASRSPWMNPNVDYMAAINKQKAEYLKTGSPEALAEIARLEKLRNQKLESMGQTGTGTAIHDTIATMGPNNNVSGYTMTDYSSLIKEALAKGDYERIATLESARDAKIDLLGWQKTYPKTNGRIAEAVKAGVNSALDMKADYQALVNKAISSGDFFNAFKYNVLRNRKIDELNKGQGTTAVKNADAFDGWVKAKWPKFEEGGLANFTGPAWLDGTPSKPEMVLNAKDTKNMISFVNLLKDIDKVVPQSNGDSYFDININIDKIDNDYDVDRMVERIKENIYQDGMYRNVNGVSRLR